MIKQDTVSSPETIGTIFSGNKDISTPDVLTYPEVIVLTAQDLGKSAETIDAQIALRNVVPYIIGLDAPYISISFTDTPFTVYSTNDTLFCELTAGNIDINLISAVGIIGKRFTFKKTDSSVNTATINAFGSETIDGLATFVLDLTTTYVTVISDGANFFVI